MPVVALGSTLNMGGNAPYAASAKNPTAEALRAMPVHLLRTLPMGSVWAVVTGPNRTSSSLPAISVLKGRQALAALVQLAMLA